MTKGTSSFGKRGKKTHTICRRCGQGAYHRQHHRCGSCGFPNAKMRKYNWSIKAKRRRTSGVGRQRYVKLALRRARNGFKGSKAVAAPSS